MRLSVICGMQTEKAGRRNLLLSYGQGPLHYYSYSQSEEVGTEDFNPIRRGGENNEWLLEASVYYHKYHSAHVK